VVGWSVLVATVVNMIELNIRREAVPSVVDQSWKQDHSPPG
jgi:hypothetical protein